MCKLLLGCCWKTIIQKHTQRHSHTDTHKRLKPLKVSLRIICKMFALNTVLLHNIRILMHDSYNENISELKPNIVKCNLSAEDNDIWE